MHQKYVIVWGFAGLGNRLRTVAAAAAYAEKAHRALSIAWTDGMYAPIGEDAFRRYFLLNTLPDLPFESIPDGTYAPEGFRREMLQKNVSAYYTYRESKNFLIRKGINYVLRAAGYLGLEGLRYRLALRYKHYASNEGAAPMVFGGDLPTDLSADNVIFTDNVPAYRKADVRRLIRLRPEIQAAVDAYVAENRLAEKSLGLHIRATDKTFRGSLERLIRRIEQMFDSGKIEKLFLCTDNAQIEKKFRERFGSRILVYPKTMPDGETPMHIWLLHDEEHNDIKVQMALEAIMDMFILSETEYLLDHWGSTFSTISRIYHTDRSKQKPWQLFQFTGI